MDVSEQKADVMVGGPATADAGERALGRLLLGRLFDIEAFRREAASVDALKSMVAPKYRAWLDETLRVLHIQGLIRADEDHGLGVDPLGLRADDAWQAWDRASASDPAYDAKSRLLRTTLAALPDILLGAKQATGIMFPGASMSLVEGIYKGNRVAEYFNIVLAEALVAYVDERAARGDLRPIRILEVGAGTGGTTGVLLSRLRPFADRVEEYCYTDISKSFLLHAQTEFGPQNPFLTYRLFNAEKDPASQGIEPGRYDLVVATNVLHATQLIARTLRNVKAALRANGLLLLNEISANSLYTHVTFGLLEGWWLAQDPEIRLTGSPGLAPDGWRRALESEGFAPIVFPAAHAHHLGQQVVIAESDGIVTLPFENFKAPPAAAAVVERKSVATTTPDRQLVTRTRDYFRTLVSGILKISADDIDTAEPLETYGIDSILVTRLTDEINTVLVDVSSTVFFEYRTIDGIVDHLLETRRESMLRLANGPGDGTAAPTPAPVEAPTPTPTAPASRNAAWSAGPVDDSQESLARAPDLAQADEPAPRKDGIAIIGINVRLPMAADLDEFWANLRDGRDCISEIPVDRWRLDDFYLPVKEQALIQGRSYSKWGGFIDGATRFDPKFFGISPRDAMNIDPHERLFVRSCWDVIEHAGYGIQRIEAQHRGRVGVFAGITRTGFALHGPDLWRRGQRYFPHTSFSSVANRVSFLFDFRGPSMPVDTQCSSSLVAIREACRSLLDDDCELAIAGGVNLYLHSSNYVLLSMQQMLSEDGRCKAFGLGANGFVPGEGVATVLLKRLSHAVRDGDRIHATIIGCAVNHGGRTNGYTVPSPASQGDCIRQALDEAGIDARAVSYVEAHGTGTELGDPIEIKGLSNAFAAFEAEPGRCAIGSVKSNIGHLEAAAGIVGLVKVVLQMKHRQLVPSLHCETLNPRLALERSPFHVQTHLAPWQRPSVTGSPGATRELPLIAGVSSFGASGVNAHVLVQEFVAAAAVDETHDGAGPCDLVVLSAKRESALRSKAAQLVEAIDRGTYAAAHLPRLAVSTQVDRDAMEERLAIRAVSMADLRTKLSRFADGVDAQSDVRRGSVKAGKARIAALRESPVLADLIAGWRRGEDEDRLADLWSQGLDVAWRDLYAGRLPRTLTLPPYPYNESILWLPLDESVEQALPAVVVPATRTGIGRTLVAPATIRSGRGDVVAMPTFSLPCVAAAPRGPLPPVEVPAAPVGQRESTELLSELRTSLAAILFVSADDIDDECNFVDMGLDSIVGVEWVRALNATFALNLKATRIYDYPSLATFAGYIAIEIASATGAQRTVVPATPPSVAASAARAMHGTPAVAQVLAVPPATTIDVAALLDDLRASLARLLFVEQDEIPADTNFVDVGLDSIVGVEWIRALNDRYRVNLKATRIYDYPTPLLFASYLHEEMSGGGAPGRSVVDFDEATAGSADIAAPVGFVTIAAALDAGVCDEDSLLRELKESLAAVLFVAEDEIDIDGNFVEIGLDSILGVEWIGQVNARLAKNLSATKIYDYPTLRELACFIARQVAPNPEPAPVSDTEVRDELTALLSRVQRGEIGAEEADALLSDVLENHGTDALADVR